MLGNVLFFLDASPLQAWLQMRTLVIWSDPIPVIHFGWIQFNIMSLSQKRIRIILEGPVSLNSDPRPWLCVAFNAQ